MAGHAASYRTDLNGLTQLAGNKIDAELYDQVFGMVGRLGSLIDTKQSFILNTELGGLAGRAKGAIGSGTAHGGEPD